MDRDAAINLAGRARPNYDVPAEARFGSAEMRFIELAGPDPSVPAPVRDVLAWVVRFRFGVFWVDLAVDDLTGEIVRVEWSR